MSAISISSAVLIPYTDNCKHETPLTKEQILKFKNQFEEYGLIDEMHTIFDKAKTVGYVEYSYITNTEHSHDIQGENIIYPAGTWFLDIVVTDESVIQKIKNGKYTGLSATWTNERTLTLMNTYPEFSKLKKKYFIKNYEIKAKEVTLDEIRNPVCFCVSIVDKPCFKNCLIYDKYDLDENKKIFNHEGEKMSKLKKLLKTLNKEEESEISNLEKRIDELEEVLIEILKILKEDDKAEKTEESDKSEEEEESEEIEEEEESEISKLENRMDTVEEALAEILEEIKNKKNNKKTENRNKGSKQMKHHKATNNKTCKLNNSRLTFLEAFKKA